MGAFCATSDQSCAKADELHLTPLELIDRIAALVPPPRTHRHRYFGVLAPNSPLRAAVTALAQAAPTQPVTAQAEPASTGVGVGVGAFGVVQQGDALPTQADPAEPVPPKRPAHYLWAVLIARIYEVFPLLCPNCGGQMRLIAFVTEGTQIEKILNHIGVSLIPRTSARHVGHRCGRVVTCRWMTGCKAMCLLSNAPASAAMSTQVPRAALMNTLPGFMAANCGSTPKPATAASCAAVG